jgi:hypothetical protein
MPRLYSFLQDKMATPFQQTLQEVRDTHIQDANWRTIEAVEAILGEAVVPVEKMRGTLLEGAKKGTYATATFIVDFVSLLLYPVPLCLYVVNRLHPNSLQKIVFDKGAMTNQDYLIAPLFRHDGYFQGVRRIRNELEAAFPDAEISLDVKFMFHGNQTLHLEFTVAYTLKNPEGLLAL